MKALFPKQANFCDAYQAHKKAAQAPGILSRVCLKQSDILSSDSSQITNTVIFFGIPNCSQISCQIKHSSQVINPIPAAVSFASIFSDVKFFVTATFTIQGVGG